MTLVVHCCQPSQPSEAGLRLGGSEGLLLLCTMGFALKGWDSGAGKPDRLSVAPVS